MDSLYRPADGYCTATNRRTEHWTDGRNTGRTDGTLDGPTNGRTDGRTDERAFALTDGQKNVSTDCSTDGRKGSDGVTSKSVDGQTHLKEGRTDERTDRLKDGDGRTYGRDVQDRTIGIGRTN